MRAVNLFRRLSKRMARELLLSDLRGTQILRLWREVIKLLKLKKMSTVFHETEEKTLFVFRILASSNPGLKTMWKVRNSKQIGKNLHCILGIDEKSKSVTAKLNFPPYFGLGKA